MKKKQLLSGIVCVLILSGLTATEVRSQPNLKNDKQIKKNTKSEKSYSPHSVLSSGTWYKIAVTKTGIYKLAYDDFVNAGINVNTLNPVNIKIYGNGGGMLPESCTSFYHDDLVENPILVVAANQGQFKEGDYILFYGQGPDLWNYDSSDNRFHHVKNIYADTNYYFLNTDIGPGKRIQAEDSSTLNPNKQITTFEDYIFHEKDSLNPLMSGRQWVGEVFNPVNSYNFNFNFPNIDTDSPAYIKTYLLANSISLTTFNINTPNNKFIVGPLANSGTTIGPYADASVNTYSFNANSSEFSINITYNPNTSADEGWLAYFELNVVRNLTLASPQMNFRSIESAGKGNVSEFIVSGAASNVQVWDVTNPINPLIVSSKFNVQSSKLTFTLTTDTLKEFIAFDGSNIYTPTIIGKIPDQDLHGLPQADLIIVTYPDFMQQAQQIANIHEQNDNMKVVVTTPSLIYNEFSSGKQDITAIRNFVKMFYDRADSTNMPKYLLLFGKASYDYKNRIKNNTNFIPVYESSNSLDPTGSFDTDDYFGILHADDVGNGTGSNGDLDIGIGRIPVSTAGEAENIVKKIERYTAKYNLAPENKDPSTGKYAVNNFADWKNIVSINADIYTDGSLYEAQADNIATNLSSSKPVYNLDKIYFAAFKSIINQGGIRFPDATAAINQRVDNGAFVINYTGHGDTSGWSNEKVLQISDIKNWNNKYNMPLFITPTMEFGRFDNPAVISGGEQSLLNPSGGGIALITSTRITFSNSNFMLNQGLLNNYIFNKINGQYPRLGDILRLSKTENSSNSSIRNFVLLGDPAMRLAYPKYNVVTDSIKNNASGAITDTIKALRNITITGEIDDDNGNKITGFNGTLYPTIFDKPTLDSTLANQFYSIPFYFYVQNHIIYKGTAKVTNGDFEFSFIVPKDIVLKYGQSKISYYAACDSTDANGYYDNIIVGGAENNPICDNSAPALTLYMNDTNFISGGNTDSNPLLLAYVKDSNGINTTGNDSLHDITATLTYNGKDSVIILNDYYRSDLNTYKSGSIIYSFLNLKPGFYKLTLEIWDVCNNSTQAEIDFNVEANGVNEIGIRNKKLELNIYPNPVNSMLIISYSLFAKSDVKIGIYDMMGREQDELRIKNDESGLNKINYNAGKLSSGLYFVKVETNKFVNVAKFVKE